MGVVRTPVQSQLGGEFIVMRRTNLLALVLVAGALLLPASALGAPPTGLTVGYNSTYYLTASWTLPAGMRSDIIEVSQSSNVGVGGAFLYPYIADHGLTATQTTYTTPYQIAPGTYYVHVAAVVAGCTTTCVDEFSEIKTVTIPTPPPPPAPTLVSVGQTSRHITASWTLGPGTQSSVIEVAGKPDTYQGGYFLDENTFYDELSPSQTTYESPGQFPPGVYYVNVAAYDPSCPFCGASFSSVGQVTLPPDPVPTPPPPPAPDKVTSFSALKCASTQKVSKIIVQAAMAENGTITVGGTVNVPNASKVYKLKSVSVTAAAGKTVKVNVKLAKKTVKAVKRALKRRKKVKARLTITAKDSAGNVKTEKRAVKLKR
jgi:hypothetical protein